MKCRSLTSKNSRQTILLFACLLAFALTGCTRSPVEAGTGGKRVIVLGIDGMDPRFLERHWESLPNLDRLRREGQFEDLATVMPPQSPVAWATFITGMDPGGHGIYDFIHRDPKTYLPYSSMGQSTEGRWTIPLGPYILPLSSGHIVSHRQGTPFWELLAAHNIPTTILRMPTNFPPADCEDDKAISGMGTPDLRGTFGEFTFFTDDPKQRTRQTKGGAIVHVEAPNHHFRLRVRGPQDTLRKDQSETYANLDVEVDPTQPIARFEAGEKQFILLQGEWSDWVHVRFPLIPGLSSVAGMFRLYAKQLQPRFQIYVSPVNIDPSDPVLPISEPSSYSKEMANAIGPYYTQGMPYDTAALREGILSREDYLIQSREASEESLKMLRYGVDHFYDGFLFFHFFGVDQDSHMLWGKYEDELLNTYKMADAAVGWVHRHVPDALLIVMSDHGFASFDRAVNLNTWLMREGFLALDDPKEASDEEMFAHVDWSRTKVYAVGLNSVYLNLQGREPYGVVAPGKEAAQVMKDLAARLLSFRDPANGRPVVASVVFPASEYHGDALAAAPDMIVGYYPPYRASWQTALGAVPKTLVEDNREEWRGDHCMAAQCVPGALICNRKIRNSHPRLYDLTATILHEFGVDKPAGVIGQPIF
jgi:predicted AlkP superfamily phosphohydrolase/phosphomutase